MGKRSCIKELHKKEGESALVLISKPQEPKKYAKKKSDKVLQCDQCSYETFYKDSLKSHQRIHRVKRRFQCEMCSKSVSKISYLKKHMIETHNTEYISKPVERPRDPKEKKTCAQCSKEFSNLKSYHKHLELHKKEGDNKAVKSALVLISKPQ